MARASILAPIVLLLTACGGGGGGGGGGGSGDTTAPTITLSAVVLLGSTDRTALVTADTRSDEDPAPAAHRFTAMLGQDGVPADPLGGTDPVEVSFDVIATTVAGSDERVVTVTIDP